MAHDVSHGTWGSVCADFQSKKLAEAESKAPNTSAFLAEKASVRMASESGSRGSLGHGGYSETCLGVEQGAAFGLTTSRIGSRSGRSTDHQEDAGSFRVLRRLKLSAHPPQTPRPLCLGLPRGGRPRPATKHTETTPMALALPRQSFCFALRVSASPPSAAPPSASDLACRARKALKNRGEAVTLADARRTCPGAVGTELRRSSPERRFASGALTAEAHRILTLTKHLERPRQSMSPAPKCSPSPDTSSGEMTTSHEKDGKRSRLQSCRPLTTSPHASPIAIERTTPCSSELRTCFVRRCNCLTRRCNRSSRGSAS